MEYFTVKNASTKVLLAYYPNATKSLKKEIEKELHERYSSEPNEENYTPHIFLTSDLYY